MRNFCVFVIVTHDTGAMLAVKYKGFVDHIRLISMTSAAALINQAKRAWRRYSWLPSIPWIGESMISMAMPCCCVTQP